MRNSLKSVNFLLVLVCVIMGILAQANTDVGSFENQVINEGFVQPESYLSQGFLFEPFSQIRAHVEKHEGVKLTHRGEAHMTLITPPEWKVLSALITKAEANEIAVSFGLVKAPFKVRCYGRFQKEIEGKLESTYYLIVESKIALEVRHQLSKLFLSRSKVSGISSSFLPDNFFPHITLGFTKQDFHEQDGAIKSEKSCFLPWNH
jgi:2'-5' RNA ligase